MRGAMDTVLPESMQPDFPEFPMASDTRQNPRDEMVLSYHRVRMALGILGLVFPLLLVAGGLAVNGRVEPSVSDFFHTTLRDVFVGSLCAIGVFLISYRGYRREPGEWISDDLIATIGGLSAFGVAFFPNESPGHVIETWSQEAVGLDLVPLFHYGSALLFFLCLSLFCYVKFPKTAKPRRRRIYVWCGHMIWVAGLSIAAASYFRKAGSPTQQAFVNTHNLVFWAEAAGVWVFAVAWLTKGKADMALVRILPKGRGMK